MNVLGLFLPLFTILGLSLIIPLFIIIKWKKQPVLALATATTVSFLSLALIYLIAAFLTGSTERGSLERLSSGFIGMASITLLFALPVLALAQWRSRRKRKQKIQDKIDTAF